MSNLITQENTESVIKEIEEAFFDIPFENSQFQTENFVINAQLTPERAYRAIGLRMNNRLRALREAQFSRMKEDIDIDELRAKLSLSEYNKFDKRRFEVDIQQKLSNRAFTDKLINDAIAELNVLYHHFKRLPRFTRQQFEEAEHTYFEQSLTRQLKGIVGAAESLANMTSPTPAIMHEGSKPCTTLTTDKSERTKQTTQ
jgi:hypothetical protein